MKRRWRTYSKSSYRETTNERWWWTRRGARRYARLVDGKRIEGDWWHTEVEKVCK